MAPKVAGSFSRTIEKKSPPRFGFDLEVVMAPLGLLLVCSAQWVPSMAGLQVWATPSARSNVTIMSATSKILGVTPQSIVIG
ncbi:MAG TPA: hypothetical protein VJ800_14135 [Pseudolabrys sp.]|nr:hypothetical protein [Pseudolabrys sp.]